MAHGASKSASTDELQLLISAQVEKIHAQRVRFIQWNQPVKRLQNGEYFACTEFQVVGGEPGESYDLDLWISPSPDGTLSVSETKIHREPVLVNGKWEQKDRYTAIN